MSICIECHIEETNRDDGLCIGCDLALRDDHGVRQIGESHYSLEERGRWMPGRHGIQRWVPDARECARDGCDAAFVPARRNQKFHTEHCRWADEYQRKQQTRPRKAA